MIFIDNCLLIGSKFSEINTVKKKIVKKYIIEDRSLVAYFLKSKS